MIAFKWLKKKKIPFTICPNISIIENQYTQGDQVRFINKFLGKEKVETKLKDQLNEQEFKLLKKIGLKKILQILRSKSNKFFQVFLVIFLGILEKILKNS